MDKKKYLRVLNKEIQQLNGLIDYKIIHDYDYRTEARRHKRLLRDVRREETGRMFGRVKHMLALSFR